MAGRLAIMVVDMKNTLGGQFYFFQARRLMRFRPATHPSPKRTRRPSPPQQITGQSTFPELPRLETRFSNFSASDHYQIGKGVDRENL
jgi:hypothetical protein